MRASSLALRALLFQAPAVLSFAGLPARGGAAATAAASASASAASSRLSTACGAASGDAQSFIDAVNEEYETYHREFEMQFWGTKMALSDPGYTVENLSETKRAMEGFLADEEKLARTRELLLRDDGDGGDGDGGEGAALSDEQRKVLSTFERVFGCYIMESDEAKRMREEATSIEGGLESGRNGLTLGAAMPDGAFEEMSSVGLRNKVRVDSDEAVRRACFEGLGRIGEYALENGFVELVKVRNRMARELGFEDYYDYKVTQAEGFGKGALFEILDRLERDTRPIMEEARARFAEEKGEDALLPWNISFEMSGDVTKKLDPYFPFEKAVERWGRSFSAMNISYRGATMDLDLLDRPRKYSNGFCHWPQPAWTKPDGTWQPAVTHFTSLADPAAIGSGYTGLTTLMHEAGHAAHFANIVQPSPLFSQERAPTSVPYAELQSMFLDSLVGDASWRARYALSRDGEALPWDIIDEDLTATHPYRVFALRGMIVVPYFERALYELDEEEMTPERIAALADEIERDVQGGLSPRPLLSVPHLLSDEASCYYHGYVLAEMAVHQTRDFFERRDGFIVDNPNVGPTLSKQMWAAGNSEAFLDLVEGLTGKALSGDAWVKSLRQPLDELLGEEREAYDEARKEDGSSESEGEVDLDMRVRIVDGDEVLADTEADGSFLKACGKFESYVRERYGTPV
mmetsp:Transcript_27964/g.82224  ORF Transcript_27964/g.82224 Transcript_27964/m.82224 type:complete len:689 (-) Transcript_27964:163-2229(-)